MITLFDLFFSLLFFLFSSFVPLDHQFFLLFSLNFLSIFTLSPSRVYFILIRSILNFYSLSIFSNCRVIFFLPVQELYIFYPPKKKNSPMWSLLVTRPSKWTRKPFTLCAHYTTALGLLARLISRLKGVPLSGQSS